MGKIKICLHMIVKNESHCIGRVLRNYRKNYDAVVISDTGSTDSTVSIIEKFCKDNNIPYSIPLVQWKNFGYNRNESLKAAYAMVRKQMGLPPTGPITSQQYNGMSKDKWYFITTDADNLILPASVNGVDESNLNDFSHHTPKIIREEMKGYDVLSIEHQRGGSVYRFQICAYCDPLEINGTRWILPLHEVWVTPYWKKSPKSGTLNGCYVYSGLGGDRGRSPVKYLKDAVLLKEGMLVGDVDPEDMPRCRFYLAQSFKDAGITEEAIRLYKEVSEDYGNFIEERYVACYYIGNLILKTDAADKESKSREYYMKAHEINPRRKEAAFKLLSYYFNKKMFNMAWAIASPFGTHPDPPGILFKESFYYGWQWYNMSSLSAYRTGNVKEYARLTLHLINNSNIPSPLVDHYKDQLSTFAPIDMIKSLN